MQTTFAPETGIVLKIELSHTAKTGYQLVIRRVIGWKTLFVDNSAVEEGSSYWSTIPTTSAGVENTLDVFWIVRLHTTDEDNDVRKLVANWNTTVGPKLKKNPAAFKSVAQLVEAYL